MPTKLPTKTVDTKDLIQIRDKSPIKIKAIADAAGVNYQTTMTRINGNHPLSLEDSIKIENELEKVYKLLGNILNK